jgi:hypothetical protein
LKTQLKIVTISIALLISCSIAYGQLPAVQKNLAGYKKEIYGGLNLHTSGWGAEFTYAKFQTYKKKTLFYASIVKMKHSKEIKTQGFLDEAAKDYVYGKLNGLAILRLGYGKKNMLFEKKREKGVNISTNLIIGTSLGLVKPIYLDVLRTNAANTPNVVTEKYDPEYHNLGNIYGQTRGMKGLSETKITPGMFLQAGLEFEYNDDRSIIKAIATGVTLDAFTKRIPIMTTIDNSFLFPTVYIHLLIGKRYF